MSTRTFLMMGRPGSGKGTQAKLLAEKIKGEVFSSGDEFRSLAAGEHYVGKRLKSAMEGGELLPHWLASFLFEKVLLSLEPEDVIVFEGACRTEPESILFHEMATWLPREYVAINIEVSSEETVQRILKRKGIEGRADDREAIVRKRVEEYNQKTAAAIAYFKSKETLLEVDGEQTIEQVHAAILGILKISQ